MRYTIVLAAAGLALLAGCSSGPPSVRGSIADTVITSKAACGPADALQVDLTNASGQIIARDASAASDWTGTACTVPFSFANVPQLAGYGIRVAGLSGTAWLTPAQAGQEVRLRITPGYAVTGS